MLPGWNNQLKEILASDKIATLNEFLEIEYAQNVVYPPRSEIYAALELVDYDQVKVVILGQDPYHGPGQANGLAFAVHDTFHPKPPSLRRILDEVERNCNSKIDRANSSLTGWAKQGVLLLNTTLTVRASSPLSHSKRGWEQLTDNIILKLSQREDPVIFLLWGRHAQTKIPLIDPSHIILAAPHPSPLARGFEGCQHFSKVNEILTSSGKPPIDWLKISQ